MGGPVDVACLGVMVADIFISPLSELPKAGELKLADGMLLSGGGCAVNTAVCLSKLGVRACVLGKVGNDTFGDFLIVYLSERDVDTSQIRRSETFGTSNTVIIPILGEDRRFIHTTGANADFSIEDIDLSYIARAKILYVGGYLLLPKFDRDSLVEILKFAKGKGLKTVLDVAIPGTEGEWLERCQGALAYTDVFLPNDDEARLLTGEGDPERQADVLSDINPEMVVVITMGGRGALVRTKDTLIRSSAYRVEVVDPSGGGDAFDAGFIVGLLEGWDLERALKFAGAIGASCVRSLGCTTGVFNRREAEEFIKNNELEIAIKRGI
ncbi:MAG: carbohydrate kinase family protein [bacterium]